MKDWIEIVAEGIEALAVLIMVAFIFAGTVRWLVHMRLGMAKAYESYRVAVGRSLLVGLELLVAADIINTVVLETTLANLTTLGLLVIIRTALGWSLTVEVEGRWPWQSARTPAPGERPSLHEP